MSQLDRAQFEAWLDADPTLRAAWDGFQAQLARDAALIKQGVQTTGQALQHAAREVFAAAGTGQANDA